MRLLAPLLTSAAIILGAPFVGQARAALQAAFPGQYRLILGSVVGAAVLGAVFVALTRIRDRRVLRYSLLAAALGLGVVFARATSTGNANVDAVEHFHFVEYGFVTLLYQRAWRHRADVAALLLPVLAGLLTGIGDEWLQWFVPLRVGELRDVALNGAAIACGLLFGLGLDLPARLTWSLGHASARALAGWSAATVLCGALFFQFVHLGHDVEGPGATRFRSTFTAVELLDAARDRASRWPTDPPTTLRRLSREDHYLEEGLWHVQRRNVANAANDFRSAWKENEIVETYFAPVLTFPTYAGETRWPDPQRRFAADRHEGDFQPFTSTAEPLPIYPWDRRWFWFAVLGVVALIAVGPVVATRRDLRDTVVSRVLPICPR